jgi:hypothetical protein
MPRNSHHRPRGRRDVLNIVLAILAIMSIYLPLIWSIASLVAVLCIFVIGPLLHPHPAFHATLGGVTAYLILVSWWHWVLRT